MADDHDEDLDEWHQHEAEQESRDRAALLADIEKVVDRVVQRQLAQVRVQADFSTVVNVLKKMSATIEELADVTQELAERLRR